jgi:tRNA(Ile)-lysidine synthase
VPGLTKLEPCGASFEAIVTDEALEADKWGMRWAVFDAAKVTGTLRVRTRKRGDRIHIIGMDGHKKVKDLFIDEKISRKERDMWPLVTDEADILWIPGLRRSAKALITDDTRQRIYLFYRQEASVHNRDSRNV